MNSISHHIRASIPEDTWCHTLGVHYAHVSVLMIILSSTDYIQYLVYDIIKYKY